MSTSDAVCLTALALASTFAAGGAVAAAPTIRIERAGLSFPEPGVLRIEVAAVGEGVAVGSYGMRTVLEDAPPLPGLRQSGKYAFVPAADVGAANWSTHANPPPTGDGQLLAARREH